jgi:beta-glucosidase
MSGGLSFPDGFVWGVATSAYQVEGAVAEDGRGPSSWDDFARRPGAVRGGDTGDVACDHYHRWPEDADLMHRLGVHAYRFSLAWPRIMPAGRGPVNPLGIAHYDRMIDGLLQRGIAPTPTLYHWDLPRPLQDAGGWLERRTAEAFGEYAQTCYDAFGDRVRTWMTVNEPWVVSVLGHRLGLHAPGVRELRASVVAAHHLLLGHGLAVQRLRASRPAARVGIPLSLYPTYPASDSEADREAARGSDGYTNRWFTDPVLRGRYPPDTWALFDRLVGPLDAVRDGDLETVGAGVDFLGVNYYTRRRVSAAPGPLPWAVQGAAPGTPVTEAGWEVVPDALGDLLLRLSADYGDVPVLITENGGVWNAGPDADGRVRDRGRVRSLHAHLAAVARAIDAGAPVRGYYHWSLLDNFEWAEGYTQRYGLVHVDYATQQRTVKDSGRYFARVIRANAPLDPEQSC